MASSSPRLASLIATFATLLLLAACGSPEEKVASYVADGRDLLAEGDLDRAAIQFRNALRIDPKHAPALMGMGRIHEQREDVARAFDAYRQAAESRPDLIEAHNAYAVLALTMGRLDDVRVAADAIRESDADHPDGLALAAALALRDDALAEAETLARRALETEPGHVNATSALAGVANARGDVRAAVSIVDDRFERRGVTVPLALLKVQLLGAVGDAAGVVEGFEEAITQAPDDVGLRIALANFHERRGDAYEAERVLRAAAASLDAPSDVLTSLVRLVRETDGVDAAIAEIDRLLGDGRAASADELRFLAADLLASAGRADAAEARLEAVIANAAEGSRAALDARAGIATLARQRGDIERADAILRDLLEASPDHRGANYLTGASQLSAGRTDAALSSARASLRSDAEWAPGLRLLAHIHVARGERDLAVDAFARLLREAPDDVDSAATLARLLAERGDYDQALRIWDHVIQTSADPTDALANAAALAIRQENWNRAGQDIDRLLSTPGGELTGTVLAGNLRVARGDAAGGREWFARAREMNPDAPAPLMGLVRAHLAEEDTEAALSIVREELERRPDNALAQRLVGELELRRGDVDAAVAAYRAAIAAAPTWPLPYRELAQLHEAEGDVAAAVAVLNDGVDAGAAPEDLLLRRAFITQRNGDIHNAIATYRQLLDAGVESDLVINNYGALVADHAYADSAQLQHAADLAARFATSREAYFVDTLGWLHYRLGEPGQALSLLRRAAAMRPDDPQIRYHLGTVFHAVDEPDRAIVELERAVVDGASYDGLEEARALLAELEAETRADIMRE